MNGMRAAREVWVTGLGIVSCLGEGAAAHWQVLAGAAPLDVAVDEARFSPYPVHPLAPIDVGRQIKSKADLKQMGVWQRIGVYAAGCALEDAGLAGNEDVLDRMDLLVAAGNGERDEALDGRVCEALARLDAAASGAKLNELLSTGIRPTLYLGELSNLLAGNIQIVHKVTGSSRTLKGEEIAGVSVVENATRRIAAGQSDIALVGGALNAEREDLLLCYELGGYLWRQPYRPVWQRHAGGGGFIAGSMAAFLVIEAREHAEARGVVGHARIRDVVSQRARRAAEGEITASLSQLAAQLEGAPIGTATAILSGASGVEPATREERAFVQGLSSSTSQPLVCAYGSRVGHGVEAHFPLGVALACVALRQGRFYAPCEESKAAPHTAEPLDRVLVTGVGHWRGEGLALLERTPSGGRA